MGLLSRLLLSFVALCVWCTCETADFFALFHNTFHTCTLNLVYFFLNFFIFLHFFLCEHLFFFFFLISPILYYGVLFCAVFPLPILLLCLFFHFHHQLVAVFTFHFASLANLCLHRFLFGPCVKLFAAVLNSLCKSKLEPRTQ